MLFAAVNIGVKMPNPFGFNLSIDADQLNVDSAEERERILGTLNELSARSRTFGMLFNGFIAGAVGAAFCAAGLFASLGGPRRRIGPGHYTGIALLGGVAGFMFHPDLSLESVFGNWLPLFTVWQALIGAALAHALAHSRPV